MLSPLARGYGSWTGDIDLCQSKEHTNDSFPIVGYPDPHRHGVTVSPRGQPTTPATAASCHRIRFENTDGKVDIPKTFLTRKGALLLFTAPEDPDSVESSGQRIIPRHHKGKKLLDLSLKLGTLDRLCKSVLQYGDEEYDRENSSVTDPRNKLFLKFTKQTSDLDDGEFDVHSQPGGELGFYLRDLKSRASSRLYGSADPRSLSRSPELREILRDLDGALPRTKRSATSVDFTESPRGSPKQRVLSSKKLTASLKSSTYLGRPTSAASTSTTTAPEVVSNLPRIPSQSSGRSRSSTKSGLWVQGYDLPSKSEDRRSSKSSAKSRSSKSSAKSRSSQHAATVSENGQATKNIIPASQTEDDITSAADEQDILLPSDAEDEDGFGEEEREQWPVTEVITTEVSYRGGSPDDQDVQSMTQPLIPQYTATDMDDAGDEDVPVAEEEDLVMDEPQSDSQQAEPVIQVAEESDKPDDTLTTPVPYTAKETTETDTSGGLSPEAEQLLDKDADQTSEGADELEAKETSSDAAEPAETDANESQTLTEAGEPSQGDSPKGTQSPTVAVEDTQGTGVGSGSPGGTVDADARTGVVSPDPSVKEKGKVTFNEEVTMQTVPKAPVQNNKQLQPPKTKAPTKPTPKPRVPVKGGNQKGGKVSNKTFVKALDISSVQPEEQQETEEVPDVPEKKVRQKLPPARHVETKSDKTKSSVLPSHMEDLLHRRSASKSQEELEIEMAQMSEAMEDTLAGPTLAVDLGEGLTAEELTLAQEALLERVKEAESKIDNVANKTPQKPAAPVKKVVDAKMRKKKASPVEEKRDLQKERAAIREQRKKEKQQRLEEALALQEKIKAREAKRKAEEEEGRRKAQDLAEEIAELKREEEEIQQAEEDARHQLASARKKEREAREQRRREDLERKKQEAIRRREKEKQMMEAARQKEEEMLKRIADNEMKRQLQEDEMRKREEEETMAQEKYEEELREAQKEAEEEELHMRELEKEAEEEAMQRLVDEREEAERRRWKLNELARQMEEEEQKKRQLMLDEEHRLEVEKKQKEQEEQQKLLEERKRLMELQRMEAEARETMRHELERRRERAQRRRELNLERRENLDNVRHGQGITRAWVFSYFPDWPLDTYNKLMGADAKKNQGFRPKPKPKPPAENPTKPPGETTEEPLADTDLAS